ncbi:hypothetical protein JCM10908_003856 [Rhodotorula pacifica]|uniref:uncharacterized protein n=1 Tax=Rhodotorula pacifica TaxID=1495444 RepID=UPI00317A3085
MARTPIAPIARSRRSSTRTLLITDNPRVSTLRQKRQVDYREWMSDSEGEETDEDAEAWLSTGYSSEEEEEAAAGKSEGGRKRRARQASPEAAPVVDPPVDAFQLKQKRPRLSKRDREAVASGVAVDHLNAERKQPDPTTALGRKIIAKRVEQAKRKKERSAALRDLRYAEAHHRRAENLTSIGASGQTLRELASKEGRQGGSIGNRLELETLLVERIYFDDKADGTVGLSTTSGGGEAADVVFSRSSVLGERDKAAAVEMYNEAVDLFTETTGLFKPTESRGGFFQAVIGVDRPRASVSPKFVETFVRRDFPQIAASFEEGAAALKAKDVQLANQFGIFSSLAINMGNSSGSTGVNTVVHVDGRNPAAGVCVVMAAGRFDSKRRHWLVLVDAKKALEVPPYIAVAFPSSLFLHCNCSFEDADSEQEALDMARMRKEREEAVKRAAAVKRPTPADKVRQAEAKERYLAFLKSAGPDDDTRASFVWFCQATVLGWAKSNGMSYKDARVKGTFYNDDTVDTIFRRPEKPEARAKVAASALDAKSGPNGESSTIVLESLPFGEQLFTAQLEFGGVEYSIPQKYINLGLTAKGSTQCVAGIVGQDVGIDAWVVGDVFLRSVYSVFDAGAKTVGFAPLA